MKAKESLTDYLDYLQTDNIIEATQQARKKSMHLLQDQGIAVMALLISNFITEAIDHPELLLEKAS
ncbi:MAG: hypothetical protein AB1422_06440 [bacterium]